MSTSVLNRPATIRPTSTVTPKVSQARVVRSEWTKLRSVRSTPWTLGIAVVLTVGFSALLTSLAAHQYDTWSASQKASFDPVSAPLDGLIFTVLAIGVLGALFMSGEYGTGMIRSSLATVPRRLPVLWGKLAVYTLVVGTVSLVMNFGSFFLGEALLDSLGLGVSITEPGALGAVLGASLYLVLAGLIAVAMGTLLRSTAASISGFVSLFFVVPIVAELLPATWRTPIGKYLPTGAGKSLYTSDHHDLLPFAGGVAVMVTYAAVLIAVAAWRLARRDV